MTARERQTARKPATKFTHLRKKMEKARIVFERYASGYHGTKPHYTASMAKALVGGVGLMLAMHDGRITPDDRAGKYVPQWANDPQRMGIAVRHPKPLRHRLAVEDQEEWLMPVRVLHRADQYAVHVELQFVLAPILPATPAGR